MNPIKFRSHLLALMALIMLLCMSASSVNAQNNQEEFTWPVQPDLMTHHGDNADEWIDVGDVSIFNDRENLRIIITPGEGLKLKEVAIHIADEPGEFDALLDKKTRKPKISKFDYKTDYLGDQGIPADRHEEVIALDDFATICWGFENSKGCQQNHYLIVHAELQSPDGDILVSAYAMNAGVFDRFLVSEPSKYWDYVTYPLAKAETGHFVDANVNGLGYVTVTQAGTTGDQ